MIKQDMKNKMEIARQKVEKAIKKDNGTTLMSTGMTGDDARLAKAAVCRGSKNFRSKPSRSYFSKRPRGCFNYGRRRICAARTAIKKYA